MSSAPISSVITSPFSTGDEIELPPVLFNILTEGGDDILCESGVYMLQEAAP